MAIRKTLSPHERQQRAYAIRPMSDIEWLRSMEERRTHAEKQEVHAKEMNKTARKMCGDAVEMMRRSRRFRP